MSDRGEYRTLYVAMADDPDIHAMTGLAFKLLMMLKLSLPVTGLGVVYLSQLCDMVGCHRDQLEELFTELEVAKPGRGHGWIVRERNIVWVVNALQFEPGISPTNIKKHVPYVRRLVAELNRELPIVRAFKDYYGAWFVGDTAPARKSPVAGRPDAANGKGIERVSIQKTRQDTTRQEKQKSGTDLDPERRDPVKAAPATPPAGPSVPPAPRAKATADNKLPPDVMAFMRQFYPKDTAPEERRRDVLRQLVESLTPAGTSLGEGKGTVHAFTRERLAAKCREVLNEADKIRIPDRAIVILLKKLGDTSDGTAPGGKAADEQRATAREDQRSTASDLAEAEQWLATEHEIRAAIEAELEAQFPGKDPSGFLRAALAAMRETLVLRAWREHGARVNA